MPAESQAQGLYVLSDLHLAPAGEQCVFAAHEPLAALLDQITASASPQWVVLNGDVFDFLQIPGYGQLSLPLAPQRLADILDALDAEPPERNVVRALQRLTAAGHTLCCLPGNHDAEQNLATVQDVSARRLGSSQVLPPSAGE
jgi:UDP-2,3-diacylglucosamine pyrophosphatase LpxH